jgi:hypothetical protein
MPCFQVEEWLLHTDCRPGVQHCGRHEEGGARQIAAEGYHGGVSPFYQTRRRWRVWSIFEEFCLSVCLSHAFFLPWVELALYYSVSSVTHRHRPPPKVIVMEFVSGGGCPGWSWPCNNFVLQAIHQLSDLDGRQVRRALPLALALPRDHQVHIIHSHRYIPAR